MKKNKIKNPEIKMGGKPVEERIFKAQDRLIRIESQMDQVFRANRVKPHYDSNEQGYWDSFHRIRAKKDKAGVRLLEEKALQWGLTKVRLDFYQELLFNNLPE